MAAVRLDSYRDPEFPKLREQLMELNKFVGITSKERKLKTAVIKKILEYITSQLRETDIPGRVTTKDANYVGSFYEKLQPGKLSDVDVQLLMEMNTKPSDWAIESVDGDVKEWNKLCYSGSDDTIRKYLESGKLSALKVRNGFESRIHEIISSNDFTQKVRSVYVDGITLQITVTRSVNGPAITLNVKSSKQAQNLNFEFTIDLVPCIRAVDVCGSNDKPDYVAKPYKSAYPEQDPTLWRASYSRMEKDAFDRIDDGNGVRKLVVKMIKLISRVNPQLGMMKSFVYKNIILHLNKEKKEWADRYLTERFIDMIMRIKHCCADQMLPNVFNSRINEMKRYEENSLQQVSQYLGNIPNTDTGYATFVQKMIQMLRAENTEKVSREKTLTEGIQQTSRGLTGG